MPGPDGGAARAGDVRVGDLRVAMPHDGTGTEHLAVSVSLSVSGQDGDMRSIELAPVRQVAQPASTAHPIAAIRDQQAAPAVAAARAPGSDRS